jgi:hypothetical protein
MSNKTNNPKNEQSMLYKKLTKVFSGPISTRKQQNYKQLNRSQLNAYGARFKSLSGKSFKKRGYHPFDDLQSQRMSNQNRSERYREFQQMEFTVEIAAALDMYADEMTTSSGLSPVMAINCSNDEIKTLLHNLYYNILNIETNLYPWSRSMCKYGDLYLYLDVDDINGIVSVIGLPAQDIERIEGEDPTNPNYVQFQWNSGGLTFEAWQIAHMRILGDDKYAPYGESILDKARRSWRQLLLMEDAVMSYRIVRAPERRVFYVDVGAIDDNQVPELMEEVVTQMKRASIVDEHTSRVDLRYNPMSTDEDYYIPVRGDSKTGDIEDLKYIQNKMFTALKIPRSYLISDEKSIDDKETLAQKDIHFARTIGRLQKPLIAELYKAGIVHLAVLGYSLEDAANFSLELNNPSKIAELQELENLKTKHEAALALNESFFSRRWIYEHIFKTPREDVERMEREIMQDAEFKGKLSSEEEGTNASGLSDFGDEIGGDLGGDLGDDLDGDLGLDAPDIGGLGGGGDNNSEDSNGLLVAPGRRDDEYLTKGSKGKWYKPVDYDKRPAGARKRSRRASYADEKGRNTPRNVSPGMPDMKSFASKIMEYSTRDLLHEEDETIYDEVLISENSNDDLENISEDNRLYLSKEVLKAHLEKDFKFREKIYKYRSNKGIK